MNNLKKLFPKIRFSYQIRTLILFLLLLGVSTLFGLEKAFWYGFGLSAILRAMDSLMEISVFSREILIELGRISHRMGEIQKQLSKKD